MSMRKIRDVLRLTHELRLTVRQVREATGVGKTAVSEYVIRFTSRCASASRRLAEGGGKQRGRQSRRPQGGGIAHARA